MEPQLSNNPTMIPTPPAPEYPEQKNPLLSVRLLATVSAIAILVIVSIGWYMYASQKAADTRVAKIMGPKVIIGHTLWPGYVAFIIARDQGYFAAEGVDVELRSYASLEEASQDYQKGLIQANMNLGLDAIHEAQSGLDHRIVLLVDHSYGSDGIIARPGIKDVAGIKGKKVAYEFGTLEEFFLGYALKEVGMSLKDVVSLNRNPEEAANALVKKEVDVAVTYEPFMTSALYTAGGTKIYSSVQAPDLISDVLTFHSDFIAQHPDEVAAIIRAYFKAINFNKFNPAVSHDILAKAYGISTADVILQLDGVKVADEEANRVAFSKDSGAQSLYTNLRDIALFVQASNKEQKPFDSATLIDPTFINAYLGKEPEKK